jgi:hypothetical protein
MQTLDKVVGLEDELAVFVVAPAEWRVGMRAENAPTIAGNHDSAHEVLNFLA